MNAKDSYQNYRRRRRSWCSHDMQRRVSHFQMPKLKRFSYALFPKKRKENENKYCDWMIAPGHNTSVKKKCNSAKQNFSRWHVWNHFLLHHPSLTPPPPSSRCLQSLAQYFTRQNKWNVARRIATHSDMKGPPAVKNPYSQFELFTRALKTLENTQAHRASRKPRFYKVYLSLAQGHSYGAYTIEIISFVIVFENTTQ